MYAFAFVNTFHLIHKQQAAEPGKVIMIKLRSIWKMSKWATDSWYSKKCTLLSLSRALRPVVYELDERYSRKQRRPLTILLSNGFSIILQQNASNDTTAFINVNNAFFMQCGHKKYLCHKVEGTFYHGNAIMSPLGQII